MDYCIQPWGTQHKKDIGTIFLSVGAVFWIQYDTNVDNTDAFSCCYEIKDFFPVAHIQLMSSCAGAGREHSQADS